MALQWLLVNCDYVRWFDPIQNRLDRFSFGIGDRITGMLGAGDGKLDWFGRTLDEGIAIVI